MSQLCRSVQYASRFKNLLQLKYATTALDSKGGYEKIAIALRILGHTWSFHVVIL